MSFETVRARGWDPGANPSLPVLKAKLDAAKAKFAQCERELAAVERLDADPTSSAALDEELTTIANKALDRGDITGAILIAQLSPRSAGQA